jgi:anthranilate 1,2-dioxygenase small subunit
VNDVVGLIGHAQNAYVRCIDGGNLEGWPDFFEEDCVYKITTADNFALGLEAGVVFANSRGMLLDRVASLREANIYERHVYRHFLGAPWIVSQDDS